MSFSISDKLEKLRLSYEDRLARLSSVNRESQEIEKQIEEIPIPSELLLAQSRLEIAERTVRLASIRDQKKILEKRQTDQQQLM